MRLCVDIMGGDNAPGAILKGCQQAIAELAPNETLVMVGDEPTMREHFSEQGINDPRLEYVHTTEVIGMDESPVEAVRSKKDSSIVVSAHIGGPKAERIQRCDAVISAGNTGACVSAATMNMRRLPGVHRPGICVSIPTFHGPVVLSDAGANPEPRPSHLFQYGLMAEQVARVIHGKESPRIGLINIGAEEGKGTDLINETHALFKACPLIDYVGYVEGRDLFAGVCDVVVTDGLVGNTLLKMAEGMASSLIKGIIYEVGMADPDLLMKLNPIFEEMFRKNDYHEHGGAPLVGVNGTYMIAHGSSEAKSIRAAIKQARKFVSARLNDAVVARIAQVDAAMGPLHAHAGA